MVVIGLGDFRIFPSPVVDTDGMILPPTRVFDEVSPGRRLPKGSVLIRRPLALFTPGYLAHILPLFV